MLPGMNETKLARRRLDKALVRSEFEFSRAGFRIPAEVWSVIESLRPRSAGELDYHGFLREAFHEYLALEFPWQESVRDRLPEDARSAYLDRLAAQKASDSQWLDPNYSRYLQLERAEHKRLLQHFREVKAFEMERHLGELTAICGDMNAAPSVVIKRLMKSMGLEKSPAASSSSVWTFEEEAGTAFGMKIAFPDVLSLRRHGWVGMQCLMPEVSTKVLGMNLFLLGAHEYADWNKTPESIAYSAYVQLQYFKHLQSALRTEFPEI